MGKVILYTIIALFWTSVTLAQTLAPATSEDLNAFDEQISRARSNPSTSQFGAKLSQEAKSMQNVEGNHRKKGRKSTLDPRDKETSAQLGAGSSSGSSGNGKDAKVSSPSNNDRGNSANAPGHNKENQQ